MIKKGRQLISGKRPLLNSKATVSGRQTDTVLLRKIYHMREFSGFCITPPNSLCFTTFMIVQKITPHNFLLAFIDELWKTWQIRILKKWKKIAGDIIILHTCTANHNHMKYSSWDTKWHKFLLLFWVIFLAFYPH